jgi:hypothetical protein
MYAYACMYAWLYARERAPVCMQMYACMHVSAGRASARGSTCMYLCIRSTCMYLCIWSTCMYLCIGRTCMYVCMVGRMYAWVVYREVDEED